MEAPVHSINNLFSQLGLALVTNVVLSEAAFWPPAQAAFLREEILKDADWAEVIDQLNAALHTQK